MSIETGGIIVAVVAAIYGIGFAILPMREWSDRARSRYSMWGSGLIALIFFALVLVPWFIQRT